MKIRKISDRDHLKMTSLHEAIFAEMDDYKMNKARRGPNAWLEHAERMRVLNNAKLRVLRREPEGGRHERLDGTATS